VRHSCIVIDYVKRIRDMISLQFELINIYIVCAWVLIVLDQETDNLWV
jgi:hypothetical protein